MTVAIGSLIDTVRCVFSLMLAAIISRRFSVCFLVMLLFSNELISAANLAAFQVLASVFDVVTLGSQVADSRCDLS